MPEKTKTKSEIPLASSLIGKNSGSIHGQLDVKYVDYKTVRIALWRKLHSGLPDVVFEIEDSDLPEIVQLLTEANDKVTSHWLSKISTERSRQNSTMSLSMFRKLREIAEVLISVVNRGFLSHRFSVLTKSNKHTSANNYQITNCLRSGKL